MIIKAIPEDFKVEEQSAIAWQSRGAFSFYFLHKRGLNTIDAIREISKHARIPSHRFSYGGKKDRHAITRQLIAIEGSRIKDISLESCSISFCGFLDRPMGPDLIEGNHFEIVVRRLALPLLEHALPRLELSKTQGFPNYFDDQRFGSFDALQGFLAEKILLGHFNGALKIYLTSIYPGDPKKEKERRGFFAEHWKEWDLCLTKAVNPFENYAFEELKKGEKAFLTVLNKIPKEEMSMFYSAYQSFLWNEVAVEFLRHAIKDGFQTAKGTTGEYVFYPQLSDEFFKELRSVVIPTAAHNTRMPKGKCEEIYTQVLQKRGIKTSLFNKLKVRSAFYKTTDRPLIVVPSGLAFEQKSDERYPGMHKLILKFFLPRGSYATMLVKNALIGSGHEFSSE